MLSKKGSGGHEEAVIASPGPYTWRGMVTVQDVSFYNYLDMDHSTYRSPVESYEEQPVDSYGYLGKSSLLKKVGTCNL